MPYESDKLDDNDFDFDDELSSLEEISDFTPVIKIKSQKKSTADNFSNLHKNEEWFLDYILTAITPAEKTQIPTTPQKRKPNIISQKLDTMNGL